MTEAEGGARRRHGLPLATLLFLGTNWGLAFSLARFGALGGVPPLGYALWQTAGAGAILLAIVAIRGMSLPLSPAHLRYYAISAVVGVAVPSVNTVVVAGHLPAGVLTLFATLSPLLTYAMSLGLGVEPFQRRRAAGILLGLAGTLTIILPRTGLPSPDLASWAVLALLTPACYAVGNIIIARWRPPGTGSLALACAMQVVATILLLPAVLATDSFHPLWPPLATADVAIISHMVAAALGALLWFELVRMTGPVFMSQVAYVVTLTGVLWGMYFFDERHSPWFWAAAAMIFLGLVLVLRPAQGAVRHSRG